MKQIIILITIVVATLCGYVPELNLVATDKFLNSEISYVLGPMIQKIAENATIPDILEQTKVQGVNVKVNLTEIKATYAINWHGNVLKITDPYSFQVRSQNVNLTLKAHIQFKVGLAIKQKGEIVIRAEKVTMTNSIRFEHPKSTTSIGFDVQINNVFILVDELEIKIQGKGLDNYVIRVVQNLVKNRVPNILNNAIQKTVNPYLSNLTSNKIQEQAVVGKYNYIFSINTTAVPKFDNKSLLLFPIDLTIYNAVTIETNKQVQNENLPQGINFKQADAGVILSSNFISTILWLIQDSDMISFDVYNSDALPIPLNTLNLSILMPDLNKKWYNKEVALRVTLSDKFDDLFIRNGRIVTGISLGVDFHVVLQGKTKNLTECINNKNCVSACVLNISLPLSASVKMKQSNFLTGIIQSVVIQQIKTIKSQIALNTDSLKFILNSIIGSQIPPLNEQLLAGEMLNITTIQKQYNISGILANIDKDYVQLGIISSLPKL